MSALLNAVSQLLASPTFQKSAAKIVANEFLSLLKQGLDDRDAFIKTSAEITAQALLDRAQGMIDEDDLAAVLNKQTAIAQIHANSSEIALRTRIQSVAMRLLELATGTIAPGLK
ncbi:FIG00553991: hypothetical protein [Cronobacter universalis NCTC 9529]|uniref:Uncharacterized protein n=1 Tax=Cronobacter universalis NCTC 9529 TaxID=1074000 RepID=A0AAC8VSX7_9ENTR|nr:hypothetical protein [Cronobacter universalis]ALB56372.1 hypothetical protein AFK65_17540 [Cronobacter universalis NCTC 9529]CCK16133.1 FIG00553991: hypothetical protein [Cronobacter universalis NCTC 9529]STD15849.1 Uncharacterised protein [Cronobacter universalis NCTC 9529]